MREFTSLFYGSLLSKIKKLIKILLFILILSHVNTGSVPILILLIIDRRLEFINISSFSHRIHEEKNEI